ncbi:PP2C family protein-serine/threonine phosphatase [Rubripirellula tenax]|nr:PP2C family protein-serine/threonine phosphatase [Rubripirellula tenax]
MQNDLRAAAKIQHALLPTNLPKLSRARIAWSYLPCDELAGDILDVFQLDESRIAFYDLDVSGHGVQAALLSTTLSRWLSRASSELKENPVAVLEHLNDNFQLDVESPQFFTCCYGVLDLKSKTLSFASAGHPSPVLLRSNRAAEIYSPGFPVGIVADPDYQLQVVNLCANDRVYIFSDGAVEQIGPSGREFGVDRLLRELERHPSVSLQTSIDLCLGAVLSSTEDGITDDDISMLGIELHAT